MSVRPTSLAHPDVHPCLCSRRERAGLTRHGQVRLAGYLHKMRLGPLDATLHRRSPLARLRLRCRGWLRVIVGVKEAWPVNARGCFSKETGWRAARTELSRRTSSRWPKTGNISPESGAPMKLEPN